MNRFISILSLTILSSFLLFSFIKDPNKNQTIKIFLAADNSNNSIKTIEGKYGLSDVFFLSQKDNKWIPAEILSIDTIQEYLKLKINGSSDILELFIDWTNGKITVVNNNNTKVIYWLKES